MRSTKYPCQLIYIHIYVYLNIHQSGPGGPRAMLKCYRFIEIQYNDIKVKANITGSLKLRNTKLRVVGHYFCCTIQYVVYCGQTKYNRDALHLSSLYIHCTSYTVFTLAGSVHFLNCA